MNSVRPSIIPKRIALMLFVIFYVFVGAVAVGVFLGMFAEAEIGSGGVLDFEAFGLELFWVRTVAEGLVFRVATGAEIVGAGV